MGEKKEGGGERERKKEEGRQSKGLEMEGGVDRRREGAAKRAGDRIKSDCCSINS